MRQKIVLETMEDIRKFVEVVSRIVEPVTLEDDNGLVVSAKSLLGVSYSKLEWKNIYCVCEKDIAAKILPWII